MIVDGHLNVIYQPNLFQVGALSRQLGVEIPPTAPSYRFIREAMQYRMLTELAKRWNGEDATLEQCLFLPTRNADRKAYLTTIEVKEQNHV